MNTKSPPLKPEPLLLPSSEEEVKKESKLKKIFIVLGGVFLVLLLLSYFWTGFPLGNILQGKLESHLIQGNRIDLANFSIVFENNSFSEINQLYFQEQKKEFSLCLLGRKEGKDYFITSYYQPKMYQQSFSQVSFEPCSAETLILLHTHPYKSCLASQTDLETLSKSQSLNHQVLMVVMCEPERFAVYG